jgi:hypothetical protein
MTPVRGTGFSVRGSDFPGMGNSSSNLLLLSSISASFYI